MADIRCKECGGIGYFIWTDCGINIASKMPENDICPTCGEHQGDGAVETCTACKGTGRITNYELRIRNYELQISKSLN